MRSALQDDHSMENFRARVATPGPNVEPTIATLRGWKSDVGIVGTTDANGNIGSVVFEFQAEDEAEARRQLQAMLGSVPNGTVEALERVD